MFAYCQRAIFAARLVNFLGETAKTDWCLKTTGVKASDNKGLGQGKAG